MDGATDGLGTLLLIVMKEKKDLKGLALVITKISLEMAFSLRLLTFWSKLANGSNQPRVAEKCESTMCPESREWRLSGEWYYDFDTAT